MFTQTEQNTLENKTNYILDSAANSRIGTYVNLEMYGTVILPSGTC